MNAFKNKSIPAWHLTFFETTEKISASHWQDFLPWLTKLAFEMDLLKKDIHWKKWAALMYMRGCTHPTKHRVIQPDWSARVIRTYDWSALSLERVERMYRTDDRTTERYSLSSQFSTVLPVPVRNAAQSFHNLEFCLHPRKRPYT